MVAWKYEISLLVLKEIFHVSTLEEKFGISARPCNILYIYSRNKSERSPIRSVIKRVIKKIGRPRYGSLICSITRMITETINWATRSPTTN